MELEYTTNRPYELVGIREGYMSGYQAKGSVLVCGSNEFLPSLELMM